MLMAEASKRKEKRNEEAVSCRGSPCFGIRAGRVRLIEFVERIERIIERVVGIFVRGQFLVGFRKLAEQRGRQLDQGR